MKTKIYTMATNIQYVTTLLTMAIIAGCSSSNAYYGAQQYQINQCLQTIPQPEYKDCLEQSGKSYEEYKQERKEIIAPK